MQSSKKIKKGQIEDFISNYTQAALDAKQDKPTYVINNNVSGTHPIDFNIDTHRITLTGKGIRVFRLFLLTIIGILFVPYCWIKYQ